MTHPFTTYWQNFHSRREGAENDRWRRQQMTLAEAFGEFLDGRGIDQLAGATYTLTYTVSPRTADLTVEIS